LGALIPTDGVSTTPAILQEIPVASIEANPNQPRSNFDETALTDLTASIREVGVLQPVLVRPLPEPGRFQLIAGERRWRASHRAGLDTIPAIVRQSDDLSSVEEALIENLHRQDLNPLDEAAAFQQLVDDFGLTHEDVARRVGKSRVAVTNTLRLLTVPPSIQHLLADGRLSAGHARALLGTSDRAFQEALGRQAVAEGWSVRAVEEAVRARGAAPTSDHDSDENGDGAKAPVRRLRPPGLLELEELLSDYLDTRVRVTMGSKRGKVIVEFATLEDLERIYRLVTEAAPPA
jgi:ParB family chromosome partitioning protein